MKRPNNVLDRGRSRFHKRGAHKRFFWRVAHRLPGWQRMDNNAIREFMRTVSWRRAL